MTLRYIPSEMLGTGSNGKPSYAPVVRVESIPNGKMLGAFTVNVHLANGAVRMFGTETAFIDSGLRFVMDVNDRDEVRSKWEPYIAS